MTPRFQAALLRAVRGATAQPAVSSPAACAVVSTFQEGHAQGRPGLPGTP
ncbi:hypothetical protein [Arthrobacter sp. C152]